MRVRKILLFKHFDLCGDIVNFITESIADELYRRNIDYEFVDITRPQAIVINDLLNVLNESFDAAIIFNDPGVHNLLDENGESVFDKFNIQFYNWIIDHPMSQLHYLESKCKNYNVICIDRNHVIFAKKYNPEIKNITFLPLGGLEDNKEFLIPINERKFNVVFTGNMLPFTLAEAMESFKKMPSPNNEIILNLVDYMMENRDIDSAFALDTVLAERFGITQLDSRDYKIALQLAESANEFMRNYSRETVVRCLINSDIDFHIFGIGWDRIANISTSKAKCHKGISFKETGSVFRNCKILLNVLPVFKDGTHDRIASGMLHRAVVMTDHSKFLDELPNGIMTFYDIERVNELPKLLHEILADSEYAQEIAEGGYDYAKDHFSWRVIVDKLISIIEDQVNGGT